MSDDVIENIYRINLYIVTPLLERLQKIKHNK